MIKAQPIITPEDLNKILNAPVKSHPGQIQKINTLIMLLAESGARVSEIVGLQLKDFDHESKLLTFRNTKNKEDRKIPLTEKTTKCLAKLTHGYPVNSFIFRSHRGPMSRISAYRALRLRLKRAGIDKRITPHTFRHNFITNKIRDGKPLPAVQKFVGHRSLQSTSQYLHFTMEDLREVLA